MKENESNVYYKENRKMNTNHIVNSCIKLTNQAEVKNEYTYKGKNYLSTDGIKDEIKQIEKEIGIIPQELKDFWVNEGYGFINQDNINVKRLLSPSEIIDFINRSDIYEWIPDSEFYDGIKYKGFVIMEYSEDIYFWIGTKPDNLGKIFYFDSEICSSFNELIKKLENDKNVLENIRK